MTHKILFASSRDGKDAVMSGGKKKKKIPPPEICWLLFTSKKPYKMISFLILIIPHQVLASCKGKKKNPKPTSRNQLSAREVPQFNNDSSSCLGQQVQCKRTSFQHYRHAVLPLITAQNAKQNSPLCKTFPSCLK